MHLIYVATGAPTYVLACTFDLSGHSPITHSQIHSLLTAMIFTVIGQCADIVKLHPYEKDNIKPAEEW